MFVLSAAQMRELDRATMAGSATAAAVPGPVLMANAAAALMALIERDFPAALAARIGFLCGGGNNGGDGLVLACLLLQRRVRVLPLALQPAGQYRGEAAEALAELQAASSSSLPIFVPDAAAWSEHRPALLGCGLLVDALFGTGLSRPVAGWHRQVIDDVNRHYCGPVVAVDVPSGLCADGEGPAEARDAAVLRARATVTFAAPKLGHYLSAHADAVGKLHIAGIGTPAERFESLGCGVRLTMPEDCRPFLAPRPRDSHKGLYGHVLVVAGSVGKSGAAVLAASAALRIGAGLVTAAVPRSILSIVAAARPELMTEPLPESPTGALTIAGVDEAAMAKLLAPATVLALGPGVTASPASAELVRAMVRTAAVPCVLDADGLNAFAGRRAELRFDGRGGGVLTPHPGEMARLFGVATATVQSRRLYYVQRLAAETGAIALLKGGFTLIADPNGSAYINDSGNPGMATAGSGDVLTGMIAGLVAQHPTASRLATVAATAYIHGRAGDAAVGARGIAGEMSLIAGDLIAALPLALAEVAALCA